MSLPIVSQQPTFWYDYEFQEPDYEYQMGIYDGLSPIDVNFFDDPSTNGVMTSFEPQYTILSPKVSSARHFSPYYIEYDWGLQ